MIKPTEATRVDYSLQAEFMSMTHGSAWSIIKEWGFSKIKGRGGLRRR